MIQISNDRLTTALSYTSLIPRIREAFTKDYNFPKRHHHQYPNPEVGKESTLLLMPAWDDGQHLGVKVVHVSPENSRRQLPTIQGIYLLFDLPTGTLRAQMDAKLLTNRRTAASSAVASQFLSREDSSKLLIIGTGALSRELIRAHTTARPIKEVYVWGRNFKKAQQVAREFQDQTYAVEAVETFDPIIREMDIISCATLSPTPLLFGRHLHPGQHYDLIGAYKPDMREADDTFITQVELFVDTVEGASTETGDLAIPIEAGTLSVDDLKADLFELCKREKPGRKDPKEITCFKSVGHALEDLAAASLVYDEVKKLENIEL